MRETLPLVSICMPHLNSRPFTEERIETILKQTLENWELIIVDSNSDDGSLELLKNYAAVEPRIRISYGPRDGIYSNLNRALEQARGDFVYIAMSDDTMKPECLERMTSALQHNPDCGICHCRLEIIDENGAGRSNENEWECLVAQKFFGDWARIPHVRKAPHDGLLHFYSGTVYTSLTQLLVRRRVFETLGDFRTDCGFHADFEWGMRVSLNENIVYLPEKLASWRQHPSQATQANAHQRLTAAGEFSRLAKVAIKSLSNRDPKLGHALGRSDLNRFQLVNELSARQKLARSEFQKFCATAVFSIIHPFFAARWAFTKLVLRRSITRKFKETFESELTRLGYRNLLRRAAPCEGE